MKEAIDIGSIVQSRMGRDKNKFFIVVAFASPEFVLIADGRYRKLNNPKLKRLKHVCLFAKAQAISQKLAEQKKVFDSEIFSAIKQAVESVNNN